MGFLLEMIATSCKLQEKTRINAATEAMYGEAFLEPSLQGRSEGATWMYLCGSKKAYPYEADLPYDCFYTREKGEFRVLRCKQVPAEQRKYF